LEKENDLLKQQNAVQEKLTELAKRETKVYRIAFEGRVGGRTQQKYTNQ